MQICYYLTRKPSDVQAMGTLTCYPLRLTMWQCISSRSQFIGVAKLCEKYRKSTLWVQSVDQNYQIILSRVLVSLPDHNPMAHF